MGYESISVYGASPVFQTLVSQGQVSTPVFGFYFAESGSELYIGGTDQNHYTGSFTYMPVTIQVGVRDDAFGSVLKNKYCRDTGKARLVVFLSTGRQLSAARALSSTLAPPRLSVTPRVYRPSMTRFLAPKMSAVGSGPVCSRADSLIDRLTDVWQVPCSFNTPVSITFSGKVFQISPSTFNLGPESTGSSTCVGGFGALDGLGKSTFFPFTL